ncbi:MAG: fibronectin type III domain-containing protein, partial [Candidatus Pacearchaeota archaeon]
NWSINCTDGELSNVSETRYFTINDTIAPSIYFNQNTDENGTYRKNWIFINITCSDINKDNVILNWNGNNESLDNNDGDIYWENKTGLNDGIYTFYAFCNDSYSNVNQTEIRNITLDTTAPNIILNYPNNGLVTGNTIITFNCSAYDSIDLANITLWHNATGWQANETKPLTGYSNSTTFTKTFVEGSYLWSCSACDSLGNCNESFVENRTFTIDLDSPIISYVFPTDIDNAYVSRLWTFINVTAYDENGINACILNWDGANETMSKVELDNNNVYCYINKTDVEGNHIYNVYVNDSAGNIAIAGERNITFDITPPIIENVEVTNITRSSAIIKWETNEYANSSINYGINISLGNLISNSTFVLNHSILITNLKLKTLYYFNITSCDFTGNCNTKGIFNFTTYGKSDTGGEFEINETNETNQNITMENITKQNISEESKMEKKEKIVCDIGDIIGICYNVRESESIYFVYNGETHKIIINKINKDNVDITIYSSPINTILKLKEPRFFDITNDNIEDIKVILEEIDYLTKKATIRIEIIECKCPECGEWSKCINNKKTRECYICNKETNFECVSFKEEKTCKEGCKFICWYWLLFIFILLLLTIIFIFWRREEEIDLEKKLKQIEYNLRTNGYDWKIKGISR